MTVSETDLADGVNLEVVASVMHPASEARTSATNALTFTVDNVNPVFQVAQPLPISLISVLIPTLTKKGFSLR